MQNIIKDNMLLVERSNAMELKATALSKSKRGTKNQLHVCHQNERFGITLRTTMNAKKHSKQSPNVV